MRTTIRLEDPLLRRAKARAAELGTSLNDFIERAVRVALTPPRVTATGRPGLPVERGGHLLPGVDLDDTAGLLEVMDGSSRNPPRPVVRRILERPGSA